MKDHDRPFDELLANLKDENAPLQAVLIYRLSDPSSDDLNHLINSWREIPVARRQLLLSRLAEASEIDYSVDFTQVALFSLDDEDAEVRRMAITTLWTSDDRSVMRRFMNMLETDPSKEVRAASATALGYFVYLSEMEELSESDARAVEDILLRVCQDQNAGMDVKRRALEAVAFSSRVEVIPLIEAALASQHVSVRASGVLAIGRNGLERWLPRVMAALDDSEPEIVFEGVRASGEMGLAAAVPYLIKRLQSDDREIKEMAIWSLGEIGGQEAQEALHRLAARERDKELREAIEDAINMASLMMGTMGLHFLPDDEFEDILDDWDDAGDEEVSGDAH